MGCKSRQHRLDTCRHCGLACALHFRRTNWDRAPLRRSLRGNFFDGAPGENRTVLLVNVPLWIFGGVLVLDEQPLVALFASLQLDQREAAAQLLAAQTDLNLAAVQLLERGETLFLMMTCAARLILHNKRSAVPHHHGSRAVVAFGNFSLEVAVCQRMVLGLHRQALVRLAL